MLFSELYSAYYNTAAAVLRAALDHPLKDDELREIVSEHAFGESVLNICPAFRDGRWQILKKDDTALTEHVPDMPFTALEKRWLKAVLSDPRIRLLGEEIPGLEDIDPLFLPEDVLVFDKYADGDDYGDEAYIRNFRLVLDAVRRKYPLRVKVREKAGRLITRDLMPERLEYSGKDDKFRLIGAGKRFPMTVNLGRIVSCERLDGPCVFRGERRDGQGSETVVFELTDRRNALERVLLHFAHFSKEAERLDDGRYRVTIRYDREDETELVIRILSFGPMICVTGPGRFVDLIKERLLGQISCEL